jgi:hypothetical protein
LHIIKNNEGTVIEIKIILPDQNDESIDSQRKAEAMINYLLKNGAKSNQIKKTIKSDKSLIKSRVEINILNN